MTTQEDITKWEVQNKERIIGWEIIYSEQCDTIIFKMDDGSKKEFKRKIER